MAVACKDLLKHIGINVRWTVSQTILSKMKETVLLTV